MKSLTSLLFSAFVFLIPATTFAAHNPAVQPLFFEQLSASAPTDQPAPIATVDGVTEVSWEGLAWEVQNVTTSHVPLVIEFYSDDSSDCQRMNPTGADECAPQLAQFNAASLSHDQVRFVRFNVRRHPQVLDGPDVRVLPSHIFIAAYTDTQHYTAIKIWGYLDQDGLSQAMDETFRAQ